LSTGSHDNGLKIDFKGQEASIIDTNTPNSVQNTDKGIAVNNQSKGSFFASKKGTKFYGITCSAGKTIKDENKIYFSSATEAINAGYELSAACK